MNTFEIRSLKTSDLAAIECLYASVNAAAPDHLGGAAWPIESAANSLNTETGWGLWSVDSGELLAFVFLKTLPGVWELQSLATQPNWRKQGLMKKLLTYIIEHMPQGHELWLEVHEKNVSAQCLYKHLGFQQVGVRKRYYPDSGDAILYSFLRPT